MSTTVLLALWSACWHTQISGESALPSTLLVGTILPEEFAGKNHDIETSFKFAVHNLNRDKSILPNTNLTFDIQYAAINNTFAVCNKVCSQIQKGARAIFGLSKTNLNSYVHSICDALDIPHLVVHIDNARPEFAINLHPSQIYINAALLDVIRHFNWTKIGLLFEKDYGIVNFHNLFNTDLEVHIQQITMDSYKQVLEMFKDGEIHNIIVDVHPDSIPHILRAIIVLQMNEYKYHYFFMNFDIETYDLEDFRYNFVNITYFRLVNFEDISVKEVVKQMSIFERRLGQMKQQNETFYAPDSYKKIQTIKTIQALIYDSVYVFAIGLQALSQSRGYPYTNVSCAEEIAWESGLSLINYINSVEWKGITGPIKLKDGRREHFKMDLVKLKQHSLQKIGEWTPQMQLNITDESETYETVNINVTLVVIAILETPYIMMHYGKNFTGNDRFYGFCVDVLKKIANDVGFDYILDLVPDRKYGAKDPLTGEWNGMVAHLMKNKADLAIGSMTITYARETVIDFTKPFMNLGIGILFKVISPSPRRLFSFMNPLAIDVWMYVVASYLVVSLTIFILNRFTFRNEIPSVDCSKKQSIAAETDMFTVANSFWFPIGTLMQQGNDINPKTVATRIVSAIWWFFTLIIIASYTANLAAFLTVERMSTPIENAEDLASQTDIQYGTLASGSTMTFFRDAMIDTYRKMWRSMESRDPNVFTSSYEEGIERVLRGNYAFLMESTMIDYIVERNCNLTQIGGLLDTKGYGMATPKNSPWRDKISLAVLELQGRGEIQMLYDKWWKSASNKCQRQRPNKQSKANALGMENIGGVFIVLAVGIGAGFLVAILELKHSCQQMDTSHSHSFWYTLKDELRYTLKCSNFRQRTTLHSTCSSCQRQSMPKASL